MKRIEMLAESYVDRHGGDEKEERDGGYTPPFYPSFYITRINLLMK